MNIDRKLRYVYDSVENSRGKYGTLKKCEFHLHTPASKDYKLYESLTDEDFLKMTDKDLVDVALKEGYLSALAAEKLMSELEAYSGEQYRKSNAERGIPYDSLKEAITYALIIHRLVACEIEVAVVCDHHTVAGYKKLRYALDDYYRQRKIEKTLVLLMGIEFSCSERNHVIGMFDEKQELEVEEFNRDISMGDATHFNSLQIISGIVERGGIAYIAHVNSSQLLGSEVYNRTLFALPSISAVGIKGLCHQDAVRNKIRQHCKAADDFCYIIEGDAHSINEIGQRNEWVKFSSVTFTALKKALAEHRICFYNEMPVKSDKYIKGIVASPGDYGFLSANPELQVSTKHEEDKSDFIVEFSSDLNCIIGGRGTGKSTLLNIIETALGLDCQIRDTLKFVSKYESIYIVLGVEGIDYIVMFLPQTMKMYDKTDDVIFLPGAFDKNGRLNGNWVTVFKVEGDKFLQIDNEESKKVLSLVFRRGYSINNLVHRIKAGKIGDFIRATVMYGVNYHELDRYSVELARFHSAQIGHRKYLLDNISHIINDLRKQTETVNEKIAMFNEINKNNLAIIYSPKIRESEKYLDDLLMAIGSEGFVMKTLVSWNEVAHFVQRASESMGYLKFLDHLIHGRYDKIEEYVKLSECIDAGRRRTYDQIEKGIAELNDRNTRNVFDAIRKKILDCKRELISSIETWLEMSDDFSLQFNINFRESIGPDKPLFKDLSQLSMGQSVVALLTFVFNFGEHAGDNTPLMIDQPEDNLDNQYIFKNLVASLRRIKNKRQVILVTHSSTIVTNADAEQVIVMGSDNEHGWVRKSGFVRTERIVKEIINYLEGGIPSFKNKTDTYKLFVKDLKEI